MSQKVNPPQDDLGTVPVFARRKRHCPLAKCQNRREMCRDVVRYLTLGGVVLLSGGLIAGNVTGARGGRCARPGAAAPRRRRQEFACRDCAVLAECPLPAAATARKRSRR